jgi:hypothetical protein
MAKAKHIQTVSQCQPTLEERKQPEYAIWYFMVLRCTDERAPNWPDYGARGIIVCERWRDSFAAFIADMGGRPSSKHSLDRKDNDGNYEPQNCRWATKLEQARNQRRNRRLTWKGETFCLTEWAEKTGVPSQTIWIRIQHGWSVDEALSTPVQKQVRIGHLTVEQLEELYRRHRSWPVVAQVLGCNEGSLQKLRRRLGMPFDRHCSWRPPRFSAEALQSLHDELGSWVAVQRHLGMSKTGSFQLRCRVGIQRRHWQRQTKS